MLTYDELIGAVRFQTAYEGRSYLDYPLPHVPEDGADVIDLSYLLKNDTGLNVEPVSEHYWIDLLRSLH